MEQAEVEQKILEAFAITYNKDVGTLTRDTLIREELSDKSILMVGLVAAIENELDVLIALPEAAKMKTIGDMVDKVLASLE
jgi:acyl carrier protein